MRINVMAGSLALLALSFAGHAREMDAAALTRLFGVGVAATPLFGPVVVQGRLREIQEVTAVSCKLECLARRYRGNRFDIHVTPEALSFVFRRGVGSLIPEGDQQRGFRGYIIYTLPAKAREEISMPFERVRGKMILDVESPAKDDRNKTVLYQIGSSGEIHDLVRQATRRGFHAQPDYLGKQGYLLVRGNQRLFLQVTGDGKSCTLLVNFQDG